jgi:pyrroloquinoline quinone (PQQ) biosynthesis protein C
MQLRAQKYPDPPEITGGWLRWAWAMGVSIATLQTEKTSPICVNDIMIEVYDEMI